jgi:leucine dehydrogenase
MRAFGRFVETLGGRYITTEDVGMTVADLEQIARETSHVAGLPVSTCGSGDTSPMTGYGIYMALKACATEAWGSESLSGRTVALQGFGHTATWLVHNLLENAEGVKLVVTDLNEEALDRARKYGDVRIVEPDEIYDVECDVFAPCALGGVLNSDTIPRLKCRIVCGAANNQLWDVARDGDALQKSGILYAPDYIVNSGGVINVSCEVGMPYSEDAAREKTARIHETVERVFTISKRDHISTAAAADRLAQERLQAVRRVRKVYL